jgi:serine/threonine-protein kinase
MQIVQQLNGALAGRYVIDREIGAGGMASVYRAHDVRHDRLVALKVLNPDLGAMLGTTRFLAEIRVMAHLQHPNLVPLFDSGEVVGLLFYVMPFVDGESLRSRLAREKQLPIDDAVHIATSIAGALEYAHAHGVVHRDLKPENILLQTGEPMVADFGIALAVTRAGNERSTQTGISVGTPQYMSPEQATGDRAVDHRSDIYSLAAVLYEMLTGEPPHIGNTVQALIARVLTQEVPSARLARPSVPEHVANAISRGLEKLPADRWSSARDFASAIADRRHAGAIEGVGIRRSSPVRSRRRAVTWVAAALVALMLGIVIAAWPRSPAPRQVIWFDLALRDSAVPDGEIALSRDGSLVAYVGRSQSIFVRRLDEPSPRELAGTRFARCPSFSPDGQWLVYASGPRAMKVPVRGGTSIAIADSVEGCTVWSDRNDILFDAGHNLFRVSAEGGPASVVARTDDQRHIGRLLPSQALPGGDAALVSVSENSNRDWQVGVVSLGDGAITKLTRNTGSPRYSPQYSDGYLVYAENRTLVAAPFSLRTHRMTGPAVKLLNDSIVEFATSLNGDLAYVALVRDTFSLISMSASEHPHDLASYADGSGKRTRTPSVIDTAYFSWPRVSPDGKRIALELQTGPFSWDIWIYDIVARTASPLTRHFSGIRPAGWSADGREVVYMQLDSASLGASSSLVTQPWDGSAPARELMRLPPNVHDATIGPPHGYVAITVSNRIWLAPADTPAAARPFIMAEGAAMMPRFSPDGTKLAYTGAETGRQEVYVRSVPRSASRLQVSVGGGTQPVWSRDGRYLYYRARAPRNMVRATIASGGELRVTARDSLFRDVFERHNYTTANYDIFPEGRELLMIQSTGHAPHAALIRNWPALVRQRAASP